LLTTENSWFENYTTTQMDWLDNPRLTT